MTAVALAVLLAGGAAACGGDDGDGMAAEAGESAAGPGGGGAGAGGGAVCELLTADDVAAALGDGRPVALGWSDEESCEYEVGPDDAAVRDSLELRLTRDGDGTTAAGRYDDAHDAAVMTGGAEEVDGLGELAHVSHNDLRTQLAIVQEDTYVQLKARFEAPPPGLTDVLVALGRTVLERAGFPAAPEAVDLCTMVTPADVAVGFGGLGEIVAVPDGPDHCDFEVGPGAGWGNDTVRFEREYVPEDRSADEQFDDARAAWEADGEAEDVPGLGDEAYVTEASVGLHLTFRQGDGYFRVSSSFEQAIPGERDHLVALAQLVLDRHATPA